MPTLENRTVALALQRLIAGGATSIQIADAVVTTWQAIEAALVPVIGGRGIAALFGRSLHLIRASHPWLNGAGNHMHMDLELLRAALSQQESATAAAGAGAHLHSLSELLGSLIGVSLAGQLLGPVWNNAFDGIEEKENLP